MRIQLSLQTVAMMVALAAMMVACGGVAQPEEAVTPPPPTGIATVQCQTPAPAGTVNQAVPALVAANLRFTIKVNARNPKGPDSDLRFRFRSTDGQIVQQDERSSTAVWAPPPGPGLHFVYVLVSNQKGGYSERRVAISTEDIGEPAAQRAPVDYTPPPAPEANCFQFRSFVRTQEQYGGGVINGRLLTGNNVLLPDVELFASEAIAIDPLNPLPPRKIATTDLRGSFVINHAPPGEFEQPDVANLTVEALLNQGERSPVAVGIDAARPESHNDLFGQPLAAQQPIVGRVLLADDDNNAANGGNITPCGLVNEFFGHFDTGKVSLLDGARQTLVTRRLNHEGHFAFPAHPDATTLRVTCEGAQAVEVPVKAGQPVPLIVLADTAAPVVASMTATLNGEAAATQRGIFLGTLSGGRSDVIPDTSFFLAYKGSDNALSGCMYYRAIGAVTACGPNGELVGAIRFDDWLAKVKLGKFLPAGAVQPGAKLINRVDLNLARDHIATSHRVGESAAVVCNYLGAGGGATELKSAILNDPTLVETVNGVTVNVQAEIDKSIDGLVAKRNLVACVAMDHTSIPGVNGGKAFTTFMIFGASGELLPRINLDGRGEKFVPGSCTICHGGDRYAGKFAEDGTGSPDIGGHMLPFIVPNFAFSSKAGLRRADQEDALFALNQIVRNHSGATIAAQEAIDGWYAAGNRRFNENYLPASWVGKSAIDRQWYQSVYKADCLGCHINGPERLNFDRRDNLVKRDAATGAEVVSASIDVTSCGDLDARSTAFLRNMAMPNALRTFDLYWGAQTTPGAVDKPGLTAAFVKQYSPKVDACVLTQTPLRGQ
jgi:hypothetical protein